MDDALLKYDESLEALEKQRKDLERVMKRMGAEWEESGAGIGWMGDNLFKESSSRDTSPPLMTLMHSVTSSEPSHDYLQSLLNVNDELLTKSLASTNESNNFNHSSSSINQMYYPSLVNHTTVVPPQQILPISPISPEDNILITKDATISQQQQQPQQVIHITQLTPPITPE
ncbi:unnamed protein product [Mucor hiemalis]